VPDAVAEWLQGAGIETAELYGQTESGGFGFLLTTGSGDAVRLAEAGEIQLRGAHVAMGYRQDDGVTAIATVDGWLCTGDIGQGTDGRIVPTGRLTEGREPASLEAALRASPFISDAVTVAAGGGHAALVMIDADTVEPWAQRQNIPFTGFASLVRAEPVRALIAEAVASANATGAGRIRAFRLIEQRYEPGDTELSPVFTLRRGMIRERHRDVIEAMLREA
jgi:long-chain acyl-CoA synthetase